MATKTKDAKNLFLGFTFTFLVKSHAHLMMKRVQEYGGALDDTVSSATTHIVCRPEMPMNKITQALDADSLKLESYHLVTQNFVAQSIIMGELQDETAFRPVLLDSDGKRKLTAISHQGTTSAAAAGASPSLSSPPRKRVKPSSQEDAIPTPINIQHSRTGNMTTPPPATTSAAAQNNSLKSATIPESEEEEDATSEPCVVERRGSDWVAIRGKKPKFTGGHTGIPWGSYGIWDEPFDPGTARTTIEKLRKYWYVTKDRSSKQGDKGENEGAGEGLSVGNGGSREVSAEPHPQSSNGAIDKAQQQLIMHSSPLDTEADVDAVRLGTKSAIKVKEILSLGSSTRIEQAAADDRTQAYSEFLRVWGVGAGIAERWYSTGCRTLEDVRKKVDAGEISLTEQQRVGLKYFQDFEKKIPRDEVARAEAIVREVAFDLVERLGARDSERTYCFATGSFKRGKPESSDVDILTVLPPSLINQDCGEFMHQLLCMLCDRGLLVDEMGPRERHAHGHTSRASWMGVCKLSRVSTYRRIDFKLYSWQHAACAVNYFANSQSFCRATRFWANNAVPEMAKVLNPTATGFKVSDLEMVPMAKWPKQGHREGNARGSSRWPSAGSSKVEETIAVGPPVPLSCETDLYESIGLAYVPVTMRYFHDFF